MNWTTTKPTLMAVLALGFLCLLELGQLRGKDQPVLTQRIFTSPADATNALITAASAHDRQAIHEMFSPEITNLMTGDPKLDAKHFDEFAGDLAVRCDIVPDGNGRVTLQIGQGTWPFPIPLVQTNGVWMFDTLAGEEEIINRHIGRDEYYAIGVCRAYVKAQQDYASRFAGANGTPAYALRLKSTPGKMDGLYWPVETNGAPSPLSSLVAEACLEGYDWNSGKGPHPFRGYLFKILTRQGPDAPGGKMNYLRHGKMTGGFALVAYPVRWGESGIMTFIVNQDGTVFQQTLGEQTMKIARAMKEYNPDNRWTVVKEQGITDLTGDPSDENAR
jgi:hypothetical protein